MKLNTTLFLLMAFCFTTAWSQEKTKALEFAPENSLNVLHIDGKRMAGKVKWNDLFYMLQSNWFKREVSAKVYKTHEKNPLTWGLRFDAPIVQYSAYQDDNIYSVIIISIKDIETFEKQLSTNAEYLFGSVMPLEQKQGYKSMSTSRGDVLICWNTKFCALYLDNQAAYYCKSIAENHFTKPAAASVLSNVDFKGTNEKKQDLKLWVNTKEISKLANKQSNSFFTTFASMSDHVNYAEFLLDFGMGTATAEGTAFLSEKGKSFCNGLFIPLSNTNTYAQVLKENPIGFLGFKVSPKMAETSFYKNTLMRMVERELRTLSTDKERMKIDELFMCLNYIETKKETRGVYGIDEKTGEYAYTERLMNTAHPSFFIFTDYNSYFQKMMEEQVTNGNVMKSDLTTGVAGDRVYQNPNGGSEYLVQRGSSISITNNLTQFGSNTSASKALANYANKSIFGFFSFKEMFKQVPEDEKTVGEFSRTRFLLEILDKMEMWVENDANTIKGKASLSMLSKKSVLQQFCESIQKQFDQENPAEKTEKKTKESPKE